MKNQTSENRREFIREASKIVQEWNVHLEIFSRLLQTDILQKTVVGRLRQYSCFAFGLRF